MQNFTFKISRRKISSLAVGFFLATSVLTSSSGCEEIFPDDIKNDSIILISPYDGVRKAQLSTTFWWEKLEKADSYNLQIVSPSFNSAETLILDTTITKTKLVYTFKKTGEYEWRVSGKNSVSQTKFTTFKLSIIPALTKNDELKFFNPLIDSCLPCFYLFCSNMSWSEIKPSDGNEVLLFEKSLKNLDFQHSDVSKSNNLSQIKDKTL